MKTIHKTLLACDHELTASSAMNSSSSPIRIITKHQGEATHLELEINIVNLATKLGLL